MKSRFFAHHPRTYPNELTLIGALGTFGGPLAQNDTFNFERELGDEMLAARRS
jgi:hypothetical protein